MPLFGGWFACFTDDYSIYNGSLFPSFHFYRLFFIILAKVWCPWRLRSAMADVPIAVLTEDNGRVHVVHLIDKSVKIKGIGVLNPFATLNEISIGGEVQIGSKIFTRLPPRLPELVLGMKRRAQTIGSKDAGVLIARLGIGAGDVVLEAGLGSAGQSMHLARTMGSSGHLITIEPREEHSSVGLENLSTLSQALPEFPKHDHRCRCNSLGSTRTSFRNTFGRTTLENRRKIVVLLPSF